MRHIKYIVIHCTAGRQKSALAPILDFWRFVRNWKGYGYHIIIMPNGTAAQLLDISEISNGVKGHNHHTVNISYVGGVDENNIPIDNRTPSQKQGLIDTINSVLDQISQHQAEIPTILGHRDFSPDQNGNGKIESWERIKECPCFDAIPEYKHLTECR